ncbi:hypothetical protein EXIGLDRAFT_838716 [Exidia glandulosa HHB12029]|uniref:YCII-related domain-containing protein n=1 Tax=Exidia glandulosa HHB12029 TaxID=1314781 RepID=A0A165FKX9_EXIGL|nr:hypothetical protein EXIGLDRAFT_843271 [Exidia glandulosa HHB12029]KZV89164.1 hypothetical protein EXIGLDRAFT_838716 [Exidia glandulosa HHB12029]
MSLPPVTNYLVVAYDVPDSKRPVHREEHLAGAKAAHDDGRLPVAGAMFDEGATKMIGSTMLFKAESLEAVRKIIESDPYYINGVWDKERITILPFFRGY